MTHPLEVWAPAVDDVAASTPSGRVPMVRDGAGWWRSDEPYSGAYRFVVEGDELPDPRSPWQPNGTRGPSHTVDHDAFAWSDHAWTGRPLASSVLYELHVGTFTGEGTFDGVVGKLDHLRSLGVSAIELLPVAEFPGERGWGYDGVLLYAPHHAYGGPDGLKRLVDAAHGRGLAVVLDVVYNHLGPSGNHLARFGPYFTDRHSTPWGQAVNFDDAGSHEVRRFFCDNALQWLRDYHIDGLRLDAVHAIHDESALHVLEQLAIEVDQLARATGRTRWLIAESDLNDPKLVRNRDAHGYGLDAAWSDDFHHAVHAAVTGERSGYYADFGDVGAVSYALENTYVADGRFSRHRDRRHGRPVDVPQDRFVCFLQNHDQIGNRAVGERLSSLARRDDLFGAAALLLLGPFVPMLFQGEEWGATTPFLYFTDHDDPEIAEAVRTGRRREFAAFDWDPADIPDPQDPETAVRSRVDWDERARPEHHEIEAWHRALLGLRTLLLRDLVGHDDRVRSRVVDRAVVLQRGRWVVVANFGDAPVEMSISTSTATSGEAAAADEVVAIHGDATLVDGVVRVAGHATVVVRLDRSPV
jgi:maltooligosyltrehalose trehalohydrolase